MEEELKNLGIKSIRMDRPGHQNRMVIEYVDNHEDVMINTTLSPHQIVQYFGPFLIDLDKQYLQTEYIFPSSHFQYNKNMQGKLKSIINNFSWEDSRPMRLHFKGQTQKWDCSEALLKELYDINRTVIKAKQKHIHKINEDIIAKFNSIKDRLDEIMKICFENGVIAYHFYKHLLLQEPEIVITLKNIRKQISPKYSLKFSERGDRVIILPAGVDKRTLTHRLLIPDSRELDIH